MGDGITKFHFFGNFDTIPHIYLQVLRKWSLGAGGGLSIDHGPGLVGDVSKPAAVLEHKVATVAPLPRPWVEVVLHGHR